MIGGPQDPRIADRHVDASDPLAGSAARQAWTGVRAIAAGLPFAMRHPRVMTWMAASIVVYLLVWGVVLWQSAVWQSPVLHQLLGPKGALWWQELVWSVLYVLAWLAWWLISFALAFAVSSPLMAPLLGMLAEAAETAFFGQEPRQVGWRLRVRELLHGVVRAAILAAMNISGAVAIWLVSTTLGALLPPLGTAVGIGVGGGWSAIWCAIMTMNFALENHFVGVGKQLGLMTKHPSLLIGFGAVGHLLAWIPPMVPVLVVSATVLACRLQVHGHLDLPLRPERTGNAR